MLLASSLLFSPSLDTQRFFRKSWPPKTAKQDLWNLSLDPKQNREFLHNNKEFQIAIKDRTNGTKIKHTHTHTQPTTKDCPSVKTDCDAKGQTGGVVTFVAIALSPLGSVTRGHERTNSARARSAGGGQARSRIPLPGLFTKSVVALGFRALYLFSVTGSSYDLVLVRSFPFWWR